MWRGLNNCQCMVCLPENVAVVERWPLWRGGHCGEVAVSRGSTVNNLYAYAPNCKNVVIQKKSMKINNHVE